MNKQQQVTVPRLQVFYCNAERQIDKHHFIFVEADRWYDAREFAYSIYGDSPFKMVNVTDKKYYHAQACDHHHGNWWRVSYKGNAANNTLEKVVVRYNVKGKPVPWVS